MKNYLIRYAEIRRYDSSYLCCRELVMYKSNVSNLEYERMCLLSVVIKAACLVKHNYKIAHSIKIYDALTTSVTSLLNINNLVLIFFAHFMHK